MHPRCPLCQIIELPLENQLSCPWIVPYKFLEVPPALNIPISSGDMGLDHLFQEMASACALGITILGKLVVHLIQHFVYQALP